MYRRLLLLLASSALFARASPLGCATGDEGPPPAISPVVHASSPEEAGHYLFLVGGCNDCHTPGWAQSDGKLPQTEWALGSSTGFRGPWGTTYPVNLRLAAAEHTERQWVQLFRQSAGLPPMPWPNYRAMNESDLVAIQRFLKSLGARGTPAPDAVPPGKEPATAYVDLTPKNPLRPAHP